MTKSCLTCQNLTITNRNLVLSTKYQHQLLITARLNPKIRIYNTCWIIDTPSQYNRQDSYQELADNFNCSKYKPLPST